jgi:hypothetical protein
MTLPKLKMTLPKYLLADNSDFPDDIYILHTEYPRFVLNLRNDQMEWFDDLEGDESELANEIAALIDEASTFYDREMARYTEN